MEELKNELYNKDNGLWYKRNGDYYFPEYYLGKGLSLGKATKLKEQRVKEDTENTTVSSENAILGKYGRARLNYIKTHKRGLYAELLMNGILNKHLTEIDRTATERINKIIKAMAEQDNTNEQLKETNQLLWAGLMNNYKLSAEEIVYNEIILA
ncbi:MAG: TnpV protein [Bacilli bacterium]|nr:TnpV protein [Bacilli bacterium]